MTMDTNSNKPTKRIFEIFERLGSSHLLMVVGSLFLLDMVIIDPIPFLDEIVLGVGTLLLARWQLRSGGTSAGTVAKPATKNVTPTEVVTPPNHVSPPSSPQGDSVTPVTPPENASA